MNAPATVCRKCGIGQLSESSRVQVFTPPAGRVEVVTHHLACNHCDALITTAHQADRNLKALDARRSHYGAHLLGSDYLRFRKRYALPQPQANKLFGKSGVAFSRYENETSLPDMTTTSLIKLAIESEDVVVALAKMHGIELRILEERNRRGGAPIVDANEGHRPQAQRANKNQHLSDPNILERTANRPENWGNSNSTYTSP